MLTVRAATIDDARMLFEWRNDPLTRLSSHNSEALLFGPHVSWLKATLASPMRQLLIAEENGQPVGTVRVDYEAAGGSAELSWTVAPKARGRGVAKCMVRIVADDVSSTCAVRAEVRMGNEASTKVAEAAGMKISKQEGEVLHFYRQLSA